MFKAQKAVQYLLVVILIIGATFRLIYPSDIEYKADQDYTFKETQSTTQLPTLGMNSGVGLKNPGMSVWVFIALAKIFHVKTPIDLSRAVQCCNILALLFLAFFIFKEIAPSKREPWIWTLALAAVNPIDIIFHRVIWTQSIFPLFSILILYSWWKKDKFWKAFLWGILGATVGQIHMPAFFYSFSLFIWTLLFDRKNTNWKGWLLGSFLGGIPLIPWLIYLSQTNFFSSHSGNSFQFYHSFVISHHPLNGWWSGSLLQYWLLWITSSLGLGLDYFFQFETWRFLKGNIINTIFFIIIVIVFCICVGLNLTNKLKKIKPQNLVFFIKNIFNSTDKEVMFLGAIFFGLGIIMTFAPFYIHRHYLIVTFPMMYLGIVKFILNIAEDCKDRKKFARTLLLLLVVCQLCLSLNVLNYIHNHGGIVNGEFGVSYGHQQVK
jgi:hypothetical protein